jgi:hypothetical protein
MHTSRVYSSRYWTSRVFFFASQSPRSTRALLEYTRLLPRLISQFGTVFEPPRHASWLLASSPPSQMRLDSPRARLAASCASLRGASRVIASDARWSQPRGRAGESPLGCPWKWGPFRRLEPEFLRVLTSVSSFEPPHVYVNSSHYFPADRKKLVQSSRSRSVAFFPTT